VFLKRGEMSKANLSQILPHNSKLRSKFGKKWHNLEIISWKCLESSLETNSSHKHLKLAVKVIDYTIQHLKNQVWNSVKSQLWNPISVRFCICTLFDYGFYVILNIHRILWRSFWLEVTMYSYFKEDPKFESSHWFDARCRTKWQVWNQWQVSNFVLDMRGNSYMNFWMF
jgi:hypothetical protein